MGDGGAEWLEALRRDLRDPPQTVDAPGLAALWSVAQVRFVCARPALLQDHPDLSVRVRGAWGRKLAEAPPPARRGWSLPPPYAVLFAPIDARASEDEVPKPAIIRASIEGDLLIVDLSIFGEAAVFLDVAAAALAAALEEGIALLDGARRQRVPITILEAGETTIGSVEWPDSAGGAVLQFRTPVCIRRRAASHVAPNAVVRAAWRRVRTLAPWMGVRLAGPPVLFDGLAFSDDLLPVTWQRFSQRQGSVPIPMEGMVGSMTVTGALARHLPALAAAATANVGSHAALGLGWYDIVCF